MKELVLTIIALGVFTMFYPGIADAGMYGEVYIPKHEFIGFFDENETYTILFPCAKYISANFWIVCLANFSKNRRHYNIITLLVE